ncbi:hypothetical protein F2Q70_00011768 [Brassica cretica]|uniref:Uncharacterized protein n=2 Tax=Brassica cretica TaxID=69181 RepID=A0A8S9LQT7_BRACR|nr:hypothetical protein F2Q70_00011768 [Brassica cretica]
MDLTISSLTSHIEAIQWEIVEIQGYIACRPEASASIDRRNNISIDSHRRTSIDEATNRGRLVPKGTSDKLQKIENTTATMKDKWRRGDEAIRDFTASIEKRLPASVDDKLPHSNTMKLQPDSYTRGEIDQLVEEIYRILETTEERLDRRCDDIYSPMDLSMSSLTSKIEAI